MTEREPSEMAKDDQLCEAVYNYSVQACQAEFVPKTAKE